MQKRNALGRGLGALIEDSGMGQEQTPVSNEILISEIKPILFSHAFTSTRRH